VTRYVLDTDICSYVIRARDRALLVVMEDKAREGADLSISAITYAEMRLGAERSRDAERYNSAIRGFCERLSAVLAWDRLAADEFASLQARLLDAGNPIGGNDAMIAAHALSLGRVLVTNNLKHFSRVPGLPVENWVSDDH
jgi:tRNA(fMet)-specific endonuclease VapC